LTRLRGFPQLELVPPQFAEAWPAKGVAIDGEDVRLRRGAPHAAFAIDAAQTWNSTASTAAFT